MKTEYRPEIDGLRTIAVLGVVFFHLKLGLFAGGFAGVDVFFVISGYLITRNILAGAQAGTFSFADFYVRRARRILPTLIFTVAATYVVGLLWLSPLALRQLAKESTHALLSISNIQYWRETKSYFAPTADQLALLHCWSLSLEEQFYLVWPCLMLAAVRLRMSLAAIVLAAIVSLGLVWVWIPRDPQAVFFLMPFRIFEFAIGASVIFIEGKILRRALPMALLSAAGLVAIAASFVALDDKSPFLLVALLSSGGAAAVILGGAGHAVSRLLSSSPMLKIGRASYSLYLCHWPIIFFASIIFGEAAQGWIGLAISLALMLLTAFAMRRYIEVPFRRPGGSNKTTAVKFASVIVLLVIVTHGTFMANGLEWRLSAANLDKARQFQFGDVPCHRTEGLRCQFGDLNGPLGLEIIGDSFARHYISGLDPLLKQRGIRGEVTTVAGCPILVGMHSVLATCSEALEREISKVRASSSLVMISQNWVTYRDGAWQVKDAPSSPPGDGAPYSVVQDRLERTIRELDHGGRKFLIVGSQIYMSQCKFDNARRQPGPLPRAAMKDCEPQSRQQAFDAGADINAMLSNVQKAFPDQVRLLLPVDVWCGIDCPASVDGMPLYFDENHFNVAGSKYMVERAGKLITDFLDQQNLVKQTRQ